MVTYIILKISSLCFTLKKYLSDVYTAITMNDYKYVEIKKVNPVADINELNYLIYLKKFSWLEELIVMIKSENEEIPFIHSKRFNRHDINFNNVIEMQLPERMDKFSITIKYDLKLLNIFKKEFAPKERVLMQRIGASKSKLCYKILEDK